MADHWDRDKHRRENAVAPHNLGEFDGWGGAEIAAEMVGRLRARAALDPEAPPAERELFESVAELLENQS